MIKRLSSNNSIKAVVILALVTAPISVLPSLTGCGETTPSNTFTELLNLVPAEETDVTNSEYFTLIDYASAYEEAGISRFNTIDELLNQLKDKPRETLLNLPGMDDSFITGYGKYAQNTTINKKYVGYNVGDVDAEIQFGMPPREGVAAIGRFDPAATKNALSNQDDWPPEIKSRYSTEEYNGVTIHSWGDGFKLDLITRLVPPPVDPLGRARPLAVTDKYLFYHPSLETVKLMIDASRNKGRSLADLPEYAAIATGLTDLKAYKAIAGEELIANNLPPFLDNISDYTQEEQEDYLEKTIGPRFRLKKFLTFGSGLGRDEKGIYMALVLYHENSDKARENVSLLKQRIENVKSFTLDALWSERITDVDIKAEGNTLLAKLYTTSTELWAFWLYNQDNLLLHEE